MSEIKALKGKAIHFYPDVSVYLTLTRILTTESQKKILGIGEKEEKKLAKEKSPILINLHQDLIPKDNTENVLP